MRAVLICYEPLLKGRFKSGALVTTSDTSWQRAIWTDGHLAKFRSAPLSPPVLTVDDVFLYEVLSWWQG